MSRVVRVVLVGCSLALSLMLSYAGPAEAACHHFSVSASPNPVAEGKTLTVTVSRDANVAPSHIDLSSVDETAKVGQDYAALNRTMSFTNDTQQSVAVSILSHTTSEPARTFRLHLSNPGGCAVNPNFVLDPDVRVTIGANGVSPSTGATVARTTPTTAASTRTTATASTSATGPSTTTVVSGSSSTVEPTSSSSAPGTALPATKRRGGGASGTVVGLVVLAALVLAGGGVLLYRRRMG